MPDHSPNLNGNAAGRVREVSYWRVEGSLFEISSLRSVGFFNWNSQSFTDRWIRRGGKPAMRQEAVQKLVDAVRGGERVILVGQLLEHILRPMAEYFSAQGFIGNRLEFRDGVATGRLREPVIRPRGPFAWLASGSADGHVSKDKLLSQLDWKKAPELLETAVQPVARPLPPAGRPVELFSDTPRVDRLNVRETLAGKHLLLIGVTGFIGKVWLVDLLEKIPNIRKITLLIRRNRTTAAQRRF